MRTIRVSNEVWDAIAKDGKFGETVDLVLRRKYEIDGPGGRGPVTTRTRVAKRRLSTEIGNEKFKLHFQGGPGREFRLPPKTDKASLRKVIHEATGFAANNG